jgi:hypothetical protein
MPFDFRRAAGARTRRGPLNPARWHRGLHLAGLVLLLVSTLALPAPASAVTQVGGDDVIAARPPDIALLEGMAELDIAANSHMYALYGERGADYQVWKLHVLRSTNGGTTWTEWGTITDANPAIRFNGASLHVADGFWDRLYVAYTVAPTDLSYGSLRVAFAPLGPATASFTTHTVATSVLNLLLEPSLTSDAVSFNDYRLYLVYRGAGVEFTRSADYAETWSSPVVIAPMTTRTQSDEPEIRYGVGGNLHCVWRCGPRPGYTDSALVKYRHAINYGASFSDWQPPLSLTPLAADMRYGAPTVAASHTSGKVTAVYNVERYNAGTDTWVKSRAKLRLTRDSGLSWGPADTTNFGTGYHTFESLALPTGEGFVYSTLSGGRAGIFKTTDIAPLVFGDFLRFGDRPYSDVLTQHPSLDFDLFHENRVGVFWRSIPGTATDSLLFDAEWRADPGYPQLEAGFPRSLASPATVPPALAFVNDDTQQEIVFGDFAGNLQVLDHDGNSLAGWPQNIGSFPWNGVVAVGDIDGNGRNEVVAGNTTGWVHAFSGAGTPLPGWPVNLGTGMDVFVSIGALSASSPRQIVAGSARQLHVLLPDGTSLATFPRTLNDTLLTQAAIGDVEGDGVNEIVMLYSSSVRVEQLVQTQTTWTGFKGKTFSVSPSLGDLDLDGNLEIVAPTEQGDIYILHHNLSAYGNGWPFSDASLGPFTSAALADAYGTSAPEIFIGQRDSSLRVFAVTPLEEARPSPYNVGIGVSVFAMPIVETLADSGRAMVFGSLNSNGYAWPSLDSFQQPGWPRGIGSDCYLTPASSDIDADGHVEVVFLASQKLTVFDTGGDLSRGDPLDQWPMYGYNPQRTFCLGCVPDVVTDVRGGDLPALVRFAAPAPNPARDAARFAFALPRAAAVQLTLYDLNGRVVRALVKEELPAGAHEIRWDGRDAAGRRLADGVYFARLAVADAEGRKVLTRKLTLLR